MAPPSTLNNLSWAYQTSFLNNVKSKASFLTQVVFRGKELPLPTETAELSFREGERFLAPFVEVNAEAISVGARSTTFANVSTPNIRIKRPMDAYNAFLRRQPATGMFITDGSAVAAARQQAINEDSLFMAELIDNRVEWMVGQLISGMTDGFMEISYQVNDRANWRLRIPRSTEMDIQLLTTSRWVEPTATYVGNVVTDFLTVKRLFSKHVSAPCGMALMDSIAADAFLALPKVQDLLDRRNISAGQLNLQAQFEEAGAILHGTFMGVPIWEYPREFVDEDGSTKFFLGGQTTQLGRVVFLAGGAALTDNTVFYGCIPDHGAFEQGSFVGKRFSKSWKTEDPSVFTQLLQSRPLPFVRRPNAVATMDIN